MRYSILTKYALDLARRGREKEKDMAKKIIHEEIEETPEEVVDRSAYNCPECSGEGISGNVICPKCGGTGKV